jgi:hypothetical protein
MFVSLKGRFEMNLFTYNEELHNNSTIANQLMFDARMKLNKANELILRIVDDYLIIADNPNRMDEIRNRLG